jgi:hypothetical protein
MREGESTKPLPVTARPKEMADDDRMICAIGDDWQLEPCPLQEI